MRVQKINLGLPTKEGVILNVRILPFETSATTCGLYYEVKSETGERLAEGNLNLTEEEFTNWGQDNIYIEDLTLEKLNLTRYVEVSGNPE